MDTRIYQLEDGSWGSDSYPDEGFKFWEMLMLDRVQEISGLDFEGAWIVVQGVGQIAPAEDVKAYLAGLAGAPPRALP